MQPELDRLNKKYENKLDQESQQKKSMEMKRVSFSHSLLLYLDR